MSDYSNGFEREVGLRAYLSALCGSLGSFPVEEYAGFAATNLLFLGSQAPIDFLMRHFPDC